MTQSFVHARLSADQRYRQKSCCVADCNSSGIYRWLLLEHQAGRVCGKHKAEFTRVWERETSR